LQALERLESLRTDFLPHCDFLSVYIAEAHSTDEWPMGTVAIKQARKLDDRINAAKAFIRDQNFSWPLVCDSMENTFHKSFGAWPTRFYVLQDNKLVFKIELNSDRIYDLQHIRKWLEQNIRRSDKSPTTSG